MTAHQALQNLDATTVKAMIDDGETMLIDVREPGEHARERIAGARLVPLSILNPAKLELGDKRVVLHCASGNRSARAAQVLMAAGVRQVGHLKGGLPAWKHAGFKTVIDKRAPLPVQRQVQLIAGGPVALGVVLGASLDPAFYGVSGMVGAGMLLTGATGWCGLATLLSALPYNRPRV